MVDHDNVSSVNNGSHQEASAQEKTLIRLPTHRACNAPIAPVSRTTSQSKHREGADTLDRAEH
jgi:hypothetical protein